MIRLNTVRALAERNYRVRAYCQTFDRWAEIDLHALVAQGKGDLPVTFARTAPIALDPARTR